MWMKKNRDKIKQDHPGLPVTEVAKKGGELWRALGDKEKAVSEQSILVVLSVEPVLKYW